MSDKIEVWLTVNCTKPIKDVLLNRGIAAGNEFRFDRISWKIIVTRTADLFLEVLKRAVSHRITQQHADIKCTWRTAIGDDEFLLVPPTEDRARLMPRLREIMQFLRGLLYEKRFVGTVLRAVLMDIIAARSEEQMLAGTFDVATAIARTVDRLNTMDLEKEGLGAEQPAPPATGQATAPAPIPPDATAAVGATPTIEFAPPAPEADTPPEGEPAEPAADAAPAEAPVPEAPAAEPPATAPEEADTKEAPAEPDTPEDDADKKPKRKRRRGKK
jgi:hypothetical protein